MAVTANQLIKRADRRRGNYPVAASTHIYEGTLVFLAAGYAAAVIGATGANLFGGVAIDEEDNSGGSAGDLNVECWTKGVFNLKGSGFSQASVGKPVYATDNYTVNVLGTGVRIGKCVGYVSATEIRVLIEVEHGEQPLDSKTETLTGTYEIVLGDPKMHILDPGGSGRNVFLPEVTGNKGLMYIIRNAADAAEVLTIKNAGGDNICTPTQNETALVWCDGAAWYGIATFHN